MPPPVTGVTGPAGERAAASADAIAEARLRQAERLRAAQAETTNATEVVEETAGSDAAAIARKPPVQPYRVSLDGGTGRIYTEVLDTETGEIIMRIPAGYPDPSEPAAADAAAPDTAGGELEA